jgi:arylsulfatase A-like enzyme
MGAGDYYQHTSEGYGNGYDLRYDKQLHCGAGCSRLVDERGNYSTHVFTREAIRVLQDYHSANQTTQQNKPPLFLYLAHQAVHDPDQVPDLFMDPYRNQTDWTDLRKTYAGMLSAVDQGIANLTRALRDLGLWNDTLVILTTDNGGPTETCAVQGSSNYPKRGGKCSAWEGGTTGDAILSGGVLPKLGISPATALSHLFHCVDWLPTLAAIVGAKPSGKTLDGVNQLASLQDVSVATRQEVFVGYGISIDEKWTGPALRWRDYKLLRSGWYWGPAVNITTNATNTHEYQLYNLRLDPSESNDVAKENPLLVQLLVRKLRRYLQDLVNIPPENPTCPPAKMTNTKEFGPAWIPWCDDSAKKLIVYQ